MPSSSLTLLAPAKINLSLRILGQRPDGYHELETLMAPLSLADELEISHRHQAPPHRVHLTCNDPSLPTGEENLCVRAAHLFQEASGIEESVAITLLKRIPHGAGLGGGSSDAAAVLQGMNTLFKEPFVLEELQQLAAQLGSDVPFFLNPQPTWCRGRGEMLSPAPALPPWELLLIKPPFSIATPWAYQRWSQLTSAERKVDARIQDGISISNDLEAPAFEKYRLLPILKEWLQERPEVTLTWMSGSGSTLVTLLKEELTLDQRHRLREALQEEFGVTLWMKETRFLGTE